MTGAGGTAAGRGAAGMLTAAAFVLAVALGWRAIVSGLEAMKDASGAASLARPAPALPDEPSERSWRTQLARNPTDHVALVMLARTFEGQGRADDARAALGEALRLAPADRQTMLEAAALHLRSGDMAQALPILRRVADLHVESREKVWPVLTAGLDSGRVDALVEDIARANPEWWPEFIAHACRAARDTGALQRMLDVRAIAGTSAPDERRCVIDRLQRENRWPNAYQAWLNGLPANRRQRVGYVYNGDFELPLSNLGFDWRLAAPQGVLVDSAAIDGAGGRRALKVEFANARWGGPPVAQHLMLFPGRYAFEGRGRAEKLQTWLGVQWGLYCLPDGGRPARQLLRTERFLSTSGWKGWREDFEVPQDCSVQILRLELANPRRDSPAPGELAARLDGAVWFDDFRVWKLD